MKKIIPIALFMIFSLMTYGQSWNPYVNQGTIQPAPLLPMEFQGNGNVSFNVGNTGSSIIEYDTSIPENNLIIVINLHDGIPAMNNPLSALSGNWKGKFDWTYNENDNAFIGVQKSKIFGNSQGKLNLNYKVLQNASLYSSGNGFDVEIIVPTYMAGKNHSGDDRVSSFTYTRAYDQGDAPESYGAATHEINLIKDIYTGVYKKYLYLGKSVDQEPMAFSSVGANGDDNDNINDEDGVLFPELIAGTTISIPIAVTTKGNSWGVLNAWFDWNGDGDFMDAGEKVTDTPIVVFSSGLISMDITIPETAVTRRHTYARFRIGGNSGPTSLNAWGEVEDYRIKIRRNRLNVNIIKEDVSFYGGSDGKIKLNVNGGTQPYHYLWDNGIDKKDRENLKAGDYTVTIKDYDNNTVKRVITILEPGDIWENEIVLSGKNKYRDVTLYWETPTERHTAWFKVERSTDGGEFKQIGNKIKAAGNSEKRLIYSYKDNNVAGEIVSYRIVLKEKNDSEKRSNEIIKILDDKSSLKVELFPNPVGEVYSVRINKNGSYLLELMDMSGRMINSYSMEVKDSKKEKIMHRNGIRSGQYIMRVTDKRNYHTRALKIIMSE